MTDQTPPLSPPEERAWLPQALQTPSSSSSLQTLPLPEPRSDVPPQLPSFLLPADPFAQRPPSTSAVRKANRELANAQFEVAFPTVLDKLCEGLTLTEIMRGYHADIDVGMFVRWVKRDKDRSRLYDEAREHRTEIWADKMVEYSNGNDGLEDVQRSKLKVDTLRFLVAADNRRRYGSHTSVEADVETTITINAPWMNPNRLSYVDQVQDVVPLLVEGED